MPPPYVTSDLLTLIAQAVAEGWKELDLSGMWLTELPSEIGRLDQLETLILGKVERWNGVKDRPVSTLITNQLITLPKEMALLSNLKSLDLSGNHLDIIPEVVLELRQLNSLKLASTGLSKIPKGIGKLTNLTQLVLAKNQITELPEAITQLANLEKLDLRGNPIRIPFNTLAPKRGNQLPDARPILDYYFRTQDQDPNQITHLYEVGLIIVGERESGKTSLARKLIDPNYELLPQTADTFTKGIDILRWEFTGCNQQLYRVNIWDFGEREIYHQTHQFFLTDCSLYLLVADSHKEDTDHYSWLQTIRLHSNSSPVLLIQNEKHNRTCNLEELGDLRKEFLNLSTLSTNLANNRGLLKIRAVIQHNLEDLLPHGIPFSNSWLNVRYALENDSRDCIDLATYKVICRSQGITQLQEMFDLSRFLHKLGICLHFQEIDNLCDRLILKPNWGTAAVYKILDNPTVKQNFGHFSNNDLNHIWQASEYAETHRALLQLMKKFRVCYEIPQRQGNYIAPHLLSPDQPDYEWDASQNLTLRYRYKGFMPKGILTRFIVEMHKLIENVSSPDQSLVWKSGIVLKRDSARAEILERYHDREIRIRLSGSNQRDFLVIIHNEFEQIHEKYNHESYEKRLEYDTLIPCNCAICKANSKPYSYAMAYLQNAIDQRRLTIECHKSFEDVNVRRLLDDTIEPDRDRDEDDFVLKRHYNDMLDLSKLHARRPINNNVEVNTVEKTNNFNAPMSGVIGSDSAQVSNNQFTQVNNASTAELLQLIDSLRQSAAQFPKEIQDDIIIDIEDIETEIKKPEDQRNPRRLKKCILAIVAAASVITAPVVGMTDFANNAIDLSTKLGIDLPLPQTPPAP